MNSEKKEIFPFVNEHCCFTPYSWLYDNDRLLPVAFKVVTQDLKSLGLAGNPNIMRFNLYEWTKLLDLEVVAGSGDYGGIWSTIEKSEANGLKNYVKKKHDKETRMFLVALDNPVYANNRRIKSQGVFLLDEIFPRKSFLMSNESINKNEK